MKQEELKKVLDLHLLWLEDDSKGIYANLRYANLRYANLRGANLRGANLRGANLRGANIDFSSLPLWCGSFNMKVDDRLITQLIYHLLKLDYVGKNPLIKKMMKMKTLIKLANESHIITEHSIEKIEG